MTINNKPIVGSSQRKFGAASRSSPQGLENQSGTAKGNLPMSRQIKKEEAALRERLVNRLKILKRARFDNFVNGHIFIKSKEIIARRKKVLKCWEIARRRVFD